MTAKSELCPSAQSPARQDLRIEVAGLIATYKGRRLEGPELLALSVAISDLDPRTLLDDVKSYLLTNEYHDLAALRRHIAQRNNLFAPAEVEALVQAFDFVDVSGDGEGWIRVGFLHPAAQRVIAGLNRPSLLLSQAREGETHSLLEFRKLYEPCAADWNMRVLEKRGMLIARSTLADLHREADERSNASAAYEAAMEMVYELERDRQIKMRIALSEGMGRYEDLVKWSEETGHMYGVKPLPAIPPKLKLRGRPAWPLVRDTSWPF